MIIVLSTAMESRVIIIDGEEYKLEKVVKPAPPPRVQQPEHTPASYKELKKRIRWMRLDIKLMTKKVDTLSEELHKLRHS